MGDKVSRRGVYYDLSISPYEFKAPHGEIFKFSSAKKLQIYTRDIVKEIERLEEIIQRNDMQSFISDGVLHSLIVAVYRAFYQKIEG